MVLTSIGDYRYSSIVNGGTGPFFYMMEQFVSMGVRDHFQILWLHWHSLMRRYQRTLPLYHAFVIDMVIAMGHGIPASSKSRFIHAVNKASSE